MTKLAQYLGKLIRERGGTLPSHDQWLEAKASEIRNMVYREDHDQEMMDELICDSITLEWNKRR